VGSERAGDDRRKLWDQLEERFPLAYNDLFARYISGKDIPQSYAMAIARQESAWNPKVRSPVGASGLMQIMPGTATHTVRCSIFPATAVRRSCWIRKPTSTSAPAICSMFISSLAITASCFGGL
jgi:soluble lytic murein transglycosylase-like protein